MDGLQVNAADYEKFYQRTKGAPGRIRTRTRKRVRDSGKKYGREIVEQGAEAMPRRGGLAEHVATKGRNPTVSLTSTGARLVLGKKKGPQIGKLNEGQLRHPAQHRSPDRKTWKWVSQPVPAGSWTEAAETYLPEIRDDVAREINEVLKELG